MLILLVFVSTGTEQIVSYQEQQYGQNNHAERIGVDYAQQHSDSDPKQQESQKTVHGLLLIFLTLLVQYMLQLFL